MNTNTFSQKLNGKGKRFAIIRARFNEGITTSLLAWCERGLLEHGVAKKDITVVEVPGAFEISFTAGELARQKKFDAIIALGAVLKGETKHDEYISNAVAHGITRVALDHRVPVIFGILTPNTMDQARARANDDPSNKGYEAACAAIEMVMLQ